MAAERAIPAVFMRGGTSKGVFFHAADLPPAGPERDRLLLQVMGSPDPLQIDGMGGTVSSTSKAIIVEPGPGAAVTYWFAQVGIEHPIVDWSGNCGNLTTAVAPFVIDEGLVPVHGDITTVRLINGNTGVEIEAEVHTPNGAASTTGDLTIAGVPGSGSPVTTRYIDPAGHVLGELLPTGAATDEIRTADGTFAVSIVDAAHPNVFVATAEVDGATGGRSVAELNADPAFLARVERLRAAAAVRVGAAPDAAAASAVAPAIPRIILVGAGGDDADITVTAFSMGKVHRGLPMTGALSLAAAATVDGTVVAAASGGARSGLRIRHPLGVTEALAEVGQQAGQILSLGVVRTARRLMDGRVYPREYE